MGAMRVSFPSDPAEREAVQTAQRIVTSPTPTSSPIASKPIDKVMRSPYGRRIGVGIIQRQPVIALHELLQKKEVSDAQPGATSDVEAEIGAAKSGGSPLPPSVRRFMEPRFNAGFDRVRIHTDDRAAKLNRQVSARAFTVDNQIFFGRGQFQPESSDGRELIAHELTHTIQQGAAQQNDALQRSPDMTVNERSEPHVQRLGISDALDYFADKANNIPGFRMFTIVLGVNPINMNRVERSAANVLRAVVEFIPGGAQITEALDKYGVVDKVGNWVDQQIRSLGMIGSAIKDAVSRFLDSLGWKDIFHLGDVWNRAKRIFSEPIDRIIDFSKGLINGILDFIRDAILRPVAALASKTRGWDLVKAVLKRDPITREPYPRTADTLIGGFMKLIGQDEIWDNLKKSNAVERAYAWFQGALSAVFGFVEEIPGLFIKTLKSLTIMDIVILPNAFIKIAAAFGDFVDRFITWAGNAIWNLLEIIFDVVSPGAFAYVKRTGAALKSILKNPGPFVGNLVKAAKLGFSNFGKHFLGHLKTGLFDWLTGSLPGVYIPKAFSLVEIVKFVFSLLGLTWANVRAKLVKVVKEPAVAAMEKGFDTVVTLVRDGPAAAWDKIKEQLADLQDKVIGGIMDFVVDAVVEKAIPKFIALFIPGAGFISLIMSIYDIVMVFVRRMKTIIQVVAGFIDSIVAIAGGAITAAASKVEGILARLLSLAINFLAGFAGLGKVADKVMGVINKIRATVDKALDWLVNWIVNAGKAFMGKVFGRKDDKKEVGAPDAAGVRSLARNTLVQQLGSPHSKEQAGSITSSVLELYRPKGLKRLWLQQDEGGGYDIIAEASDPKKVAKLKRKGHSVTLRATIEVSQPITTKLEGVAAFAKQAKRDESGRVIMESGKPVMEVAQDVGGALKPAEREGGGARSKAAAGLVTPFEAGATKIEVHAWNVGEAQQESNSSHAERQLQVFLTRNSAVLSQIKSIEIQITDSPCADCISILISIRSKMQKDAIATLTYESAYKSLKNPSKSTTTGMLASLKGAGWSNVSGPGVDGPAEVTAEPAG